MKSLVSLLLVIAALGVAAPESHGPKLALKLRSESASFNLQGNIRLELQRENVGVQNLLVLRSWGWGVGRTHIRVFDSSGKEVTTDFMADEVPPPPTSSDYVLLEPNEFIGIRLNEAATHFVSKSGDYEFVVEYTSYLSEDYARQAMKLPNESLWSRERGTVLSNKLKIHITD